MHNIGIFHIRYEKVKNEKGKTRTKKRFLYLDNFSYTSSLDLYKKSKELLKRYANMNNIIMLDYEPTESAYVTYNTSKNKILLYPVKDREQ